MRQTGLVIGLRVEHPNGAVFLQQELFALGLWAIASGFDQSVLQFKPGSAAGRRSRPTRALERLEEALVRAKDVDRPVPKRHRMASKHALLKPDGQPLGQAGAAEAELASAALARYSGGRVRPPRIRPPRREHDLPGAAAGG